MNEASRGPGWKLPLILLGIVGFLALGGLGISLRLDTLLEEHRRECLSIQQAFPVDVSPRPPILGPEEKGNVWELLLPAFAGIEKLDEYDNIDNFDAHGTTADTPRLIDAARPHLELCRRAACRRDRAWRGEPRPDGMQALRAVRALSSRGLLLWRAGRDAEAADWMIAALTVGYDWAALTGDWSALALTEKWAVADLRDFLSEQSLSPAQLEDLGRRLALLRSVRPSFAIRLRQASSLARLDILDEPIWISEEDSKSDSVPLTSLIGWRDGYSLRLAKVRILNSLRACERELEGVPWETPANADQEAKRIIDTYRGRFVHPLIPYLMEFFHQAHSLQLFDVLAVAIDCARFQALHGRLPKTWAESGITRPLYSWLTLEGEQLTVVGAKLRDWPIGRRK
jgi:hypothetical protein